MKEICKDIKGYEGLYLISNYGIVKSLINNKHQLRKKSKILKPYLDKDGYETVRLYKNKKAISKKIHRLVAETFIPNPNKKLFVDYIDTNRINNFVHNLRWVTSCENSNNINTINHLKEIGIKYKKEYGKQIKNKITNKYYISIIEASRQTKISRTKIQNCLKNKKEGWEYV